MLPFPVRPFLGKIQDPCTACQLAVKLANTFPSGLDRISSYRAAVSLCERWFTVSAGTDNSSTVESELIRVREALLRSETENQLKMLGLKDFIPFIENPSDLIRRLYIERSGAALDSKGRSALCFIV
jgi:hypothetical protein